MAATQPRPDYKLRVAEGSGEGGVWAGAWVLLRQATTTPKKLWEESIEAFGRRLREIVAYINDEYDVEALSREFPGRVQKLIDNEGGKLSK